MELKDLTRTIRHGMALSLGIAIPLWIVWDLSHAAGFALGGIWSSINLWAWKGLFGEICENKRWWVVVVFVQLKLPVLYGVGAVLLLYTHLSVIAGLCGFQVPFVLLLAQAVYYVKTESDTMAG